MKYIAGKQVPVKGTRPERTAGTVFFMVSCLVEGGKVSQAEIDARKYSFEIVQKAGTYQEPNAAAEPTDAELSEEEKKLFEVFDELETKINALTTYQEIYNVLRSMGKNIQGFTIGELKEYYGLTKESTPAEWKESLIDDIKTRYVLYDKVDAKVQLSILTRIQNILNKASGEQNVSTSI
jgi:hypothetical protein